GVFIGITGANYGMCACQGLSTIDKTCSQKSSSLEEERSRRVGVRSIYARNNEDGEVSNHEDSIADKTSPVVGGAPRTTSSPPGSRSDRGDTGTPSPRKSRPLSISEDGPASKKRPAETILSPGQPVKRGRGRPPGSGNRVSQAVPKEEDEDYMPPVSMLSPASRARRGIVPTQPPLSAFLEQPVLDAQNEVQKQIITEHPDDQDHLQVSL
ncbi:hypothetical protein PENTCL1PPCAC_10381, partial [Pristionchus entomophagus]